MSDVMTKKKDTAKPNTTKSNRNGIIENVKLKINALVNKPVEEVTLRKYSPGIYLYPIFIFSPIAFGLQYIQEARMVDNGAPISWISVLWLFTLFYDFVVIGFEWIFYFHDDSFDNWYAIRHGSISDTWISNKRSDYGL